MFAANALPLIPDRLDWNAVFAKSTGCIQRLMTAPPPRAAVFDRNVQRSTLAAPEVATAPPDTDAPFVSKMASVNVIARSLPVATAPPNAAELDRNRLPETTNVSATVLESLRAA